MKKVTLNDILKLYNFRNYRSDLEFESKRYDTYNIRIYLTDDIDSDCRYVEFGVYDYAEDDYKEKLYKSFIDEKTLKREVTGMCFDYMLETFCVWLGE